MPVTCIKIDEVDHDIRVDRWFKRYYPLMSFSVIAKLIRKGQIRINGKRIQTSTRLQEHDQIKFPLIEQEEVMFKKKKISQVIIDEILANILYKDKNIIAINKPAQLATQGGTKIKVSLDDITEHLKFGNSDKPKLVHRLDKDTSGVIILARTTQVAAKLSEMIRAKKLSKTYLTILCGKPQESSDKINIPLEKAVKDKFEKVTESNEKSKVAITEYRVIDSIGSIASLVEMRPITGRTHQIRVHASLINCPILGDHKYNSEPFNAEFDVDNQLYLHSYIVSFEYEGKNIEIKAPLPGHFKAALRAYGLNL